MKKPITLVSTICTLLFLTAIIVFASGVYIDKKKGTVKADARYEQLLNQTKEAFMTSSYGSQEFSLNFIRAIGNINDFSSLKLEVNGTLVYSYPPSTFSFPSPELIKTYSDSVNVSGKNFTIRASIYLMTPGSIYNHSRFAFLLILTGTLLVGIFILFTNGSESSSDDEYKIRPKKSAEIDKISETSTEKPETETETEKTPLESKEEPTQQQESEPVFEPETIETEPKESDESSKEETDSVSIDFPAETPVFDEEDEQEWNDDELFNDSIDDSDSGLDIIDQMEQENLALSDEDFFAKEQEEEPISPSVSPVTNLSLQSSLEEKLDENILSNPNATLALVKINGLDRGNSISQGIVSILTKSTEAQQLFEYKADSYAQILAADLQTTVDNFEDIYNKIADFLKDNNATNEVSVGISSAGGRNIKAERVILEANQALDYASQDPDSPIVAFRANPEKYKEYMESND